MRQLLRWIDLSESAKDLVLGMLDTDPKKRLTAKQVRISCHMFPIDTSLCSSERLCIFVLLK